MQYIVDESIYFDKAVDVVDYISEHMEESYFDDFLDEEYGEVEICGYSYSASYALRMVDEVAYRCGYADFTGTLDIEDDIKMLSDGETVDLYGFTVTAEEDEYEEY